MPARPVHAVEARSAVGVGLLWGLGGLGLLLVTIAGAGRGLAPSTLALLVAGLAGILIVVRPEWGVVVLTSTFFLSYPEVLEGSGRLTINNVLGLLLAALLAVRVGIERRAEFLSSRPVQLFLVLGLALLVSHVLAPQLPNLPGIEARIPPTWRVQELLSRTAYLLFFVAFIQARWQLLVLVWLVVGSVLLTAPSAIWNALAADTEMARAAASFGINIARNPNRLAFLCAMAIAIIGHAVPEARTRAARVGGLVAIAVLILTIFLTASRSGLIELVALLVMFVGGMGAHYRRTRVFVLALAISAGIGLTLVPEQHFDRMTNFFRTERGESAVSTRNRLELLGTGVRMFADRPVIGVGIENFRRVSITEYGSRRLSALHNSYLLTLVEGGLLLFIPYLLILGCLWRELRHTGGLAARRSGPRLAWLVGATRTVFVLFLIFSFFADVWHELFLYLITGLTVTLGRLYRRDHRPTPA
jgi:O-antigen ligase